MATSVAGCGAVAAAIEDKDAPWTSRFLGERKCFPEYETITDIGFGSQRLLRTDCAQINLDATTSFSSVTRHPYMPELNAHIYQPIGGISPVPLVNNFVGACLVPSPTSNPRTYAFGVITKPIIERYGAKPSGWTIKVGVLSAVDVIQAVPAIDGDPRCPRGGLEGMTLPPF